MNFVTRIVVALGMFAASYLLFRHWLSDYTVPYGFGWLTSAVFTGLVIIRVDWALAKHFGRSA